MPELSVNRTLVKSPPELWPEFSEVERLANHLGEFGDIRITKVEPETAVAWEGEHASGTVELETSGRGTKVTMRAQVREVEAPAPPPPLAVHRLIPDLEAWDRSAAEIENHAGWQTAAAQRAAERAEERARRTSKRGVSRWPLRGRRAEPEAIPVTASTPHGPALSDPPPVSEPAPPAATVENERDAAAASTVDEERALAVLETALDSL